MTSEKMMTKYADLLVDLGTALQKGDVLILEVESENYAFARAVVKSAFEHGAADVVVHYKDPYIEKYRAVLGGLECAESVLPWQKESLSTYIDKGACSLLLKSPHPVLLAGCSTDVTAAIQKASNELRNIIRSGWAKHGTRWCIACVPNRDWAKFLYPALSEEEAECKLWDTMMQLCKVEEDNDPVKDWLEFNERYSRYSAALNGLHVDRIRFKNSAGTDLTVGLNPKAVWVGGTPGMNRKTTDNLPNIPTNEISTSPDKYRVDGTVCLTKPLVYGGSIIDDFTLTFENGKVVSYHAKRGEELLGRLLAGDAGSCRLGEIAFVERDLPIEKTGLVFFETLLDENASCHMALGNGFPVCISGFSQTDPNEWEKECLNSSKQHIDIMFGSEDMDAVGYTKEDREIQIFRHGKFVL